MLRTMRANTKWVMLIVALAFVGLMVFQWGMDISGGSSPVLTGEVGTVNGTTITYQRWTVAYRNLSDQARQQKGSALNDLELDLVEEQAWNQLVSQILIAQELKRRGITVTDEEVRLAFRTAPPPWLQQNELFQTDGAFDFEKYRRFFAGPAVDPQLLLQIEQYYRDVLPRTRLFEQVSTAIYVSDAELWETYRDGRETVRVKYAIFDPETEVADEDVAVTADELQDHYRANRDDFRTPATARVRLVQFSKRPSPGDTAAAFETAYEVREEILAGADFTEQARTLSADRASAEGGGDLGWFERGDMTPALEQAAFSLAPGRLSEPVLTPFGYHIIKVMERDGDRVRASHILIPISLGDENEDQLFGMVDRLERIALTKGLDVAVDSVGVQPRTVTLAKGSEFVPGIGRFGPANDWAFHDSTFVLDLSPVYETDDGFYLFELIEREPASVIPFAEAEPSVRRRVLLEKKKETARWMADQIAGELVDGRSLDEVLARHGLEVRQSEPFTRFDFVPGIGQANAVIGTAFGLAVDEVAGPIETGDRIYFIEVTERNPVDRESFDLEKEDMRARLTLQREQMALDEWLEDLREKATIVDRRRELFQPS